MIVTYRRAKTAEQAELTELCRRASGDKEAAVPCGDIEVAETDGEIVGISVCIPAGDSVRLELSVDPESSGCGIGRALLRRAVAQAFGRGAFSVILTNVPAKDRHFHALLQSEGFRRIGRLETRKGEVRLYQKTNALPR